MYDLNSTTDQLLSPEEKRELLETLDQYRQRFRRQSPVLKPAADAS